MLNATYRFHGYNALRYAYKNGRSLRGDYFSLKYLENDRRQNPRVAVVVSKKVLKGAVGRNRIRRRIYEQFRRELPKFASNMDIICIVHSADLRTIDNETLNSLITDAFTRAGLYKTSEKSDTL